MIGRGAMICNESIIEVIDLISETDPEESKSELNIESEEEEQTFFIIDRTPDFKNLEPLGKRGRPNRVRITLEELENEEAIDGRGGLRRRKRKSKTIVRKQLMEKIEGEYVEGMNLERGSEVEPSPKRRRHLEEQDRISDKLTSVDKDNNTDTVEEIKSDDKNRNFEKRSQQNQTKLSSPIKLVEISGEENVSNPLVIEDSGDEDIMIIEDFSHSQAPLFIPLSMGASNNNLPTETKKMGLLRPIVIDGSNVAFGHGKDKFSSKGILICVEYFEKRGHKVIVFVPQFRRCHFLTMDKEILDKLEKKGTLAFTPSRNIDGMNVCCYDDRFIVEYAANVGGVIVSRDNFRDLIDESPLFKETINNRLLMYTWANDMLMFPNDPMGRRGPNLNDFLRFPIEKDDDGWTPIKDSVSKNINSMKKKKRGKILVTPKINKKLLKRTKRKEMKSRSKIRLP